MYNSRRSYESIHSHRYVNWNLIDKAGHAVDTNADVDYVFVGDPKQFSCYSTLRLPRNSAMDAALHQHCTIPAGLMEVDTPASADLKCEPVKYLSSRRQNNSEDLFKAKHTVDACQGLTSKIALLPTGRPSGIGCSSNLRRHMVSLSRHSPVVGTNNHVSSVFQANTLS